MNAARLNELQTHFAAVAKTVGGQFAKANSHFVALVGKWSRSDLVPGLSDMDFRIICDGQTTPADWVQIDRVMGQIHLEMVRAHPEWNRINEHTAGAAMTVEEVMDPRFYNPEYAVWDLWWGASDWFDQLQHHVAARPFGYSDEHAHLLRFLTYYSPYIHGIDPPHNLGEFTDKYALHSRCWHYFAPPILSAVCLLARKKFPGKRQGFTWLRDNGFIVEQIDAVLAQVEAHYERAELNDPKRLAAFEKFLFTAFEQLYEPLCTSIREVPLELPASPAELKRQLAVSRPEPLEMLMDLVRWARTRAGRYYFYLNAPDHFAAGELMHTELPWAKKIANVSREIMGRVLGKENLTTEQCLSELGIEINAIERDALGHMQMMADWDGDGQPLEQLYRGAVELYPHYYLILERVLARLAAR